MKGFLMQTEVLQVDSDDIESVHGRVVVVVSEGSRTRSALETAAAYIQQSQIVAFPTETVYGLGADARNEQAVARIYSAKQRPSDNPLIVHIADTSQWPDAIPAVYAPLIARFWPGALTIILPLGSSGICSLVRGGGQTVAVRVPASKIALALIAMADAPLAAPSANLSTRPSPTLAAHVVEDLGGRVPLVLDAGVLCDVGVESTVVDGLVDPPVILRPGGVSMEQIRGVGGPWAHVQVNSGIEAGVLKTPGMKYMHYSPNAKVVLVEAAATTKDVDVDTILDQVSGAVVVVFATKTWHRDMLKSKRAFKFVELGRRAAEINQNLFLELRRADQVSADVIIIEGVNEADTGMAFMNRCRKMATLVV